MQIQHIGYGIKGFYRMADYALKLAYMLTKEAERRSDILYFYRKHGLKATCDAFDISKSTLYNWKRAQKEAGGKKEGLNPKSRAPRTKRKRLWPMEVIQEIRRIRIEHPNLGKEKIHIFLICFCAKSSFRCPSIRTIGRIIADDPNKMRTFPQRVGHNGQTKRIKRTKRARKPSGYKPKRPGECLAFDTVETVIHGSKVYTITCIDIYSRFALAYTTRSHASKAAKDFFLAIKELFPYKITNVLTDNGSEFVLHFDKAIKEQCDEHWHTYPRTPKMNAHCERFNRTLQEEFLNYHKPEMVDLPLFNKITSEWLIWYNGTRPHHSLDLKSPVQYLQSNHQECNLWWPNTRA